MDSDSWNEAEVNFFITEKLFLWDYLDYLKNRAKFGDMAVLQLTFRNVSLEKCPKIDPATSDLPAWGSTFPPHWIWSTETLFQNFQIFDDILFNLANFLEEALSKSMRISKKRIETVGNHVQTVGTC